MKARIVEKVLQVTKLVTEQSCKGKFSRHFAKMGGGRGRAEGLGGLGWGTRGGMGSRG